MKRHLLLPLFILLALTATAKEWAPIGASWYYGQAFAFSAAQDYVQYTSEKDTTIKGQACRKIVKKNDFYQRQRFEYMYSKNDSVYFYDNDLDTFQLLYDFNAAANDSWTINIKRTNTPVNSITITVDSVGSININRETAKKLYVSYSFKIRESEEHYTSTIIENIGDEMMMFNIETYDPLLASDVSYSTGIRCYDDPKEGNYHFESQYYCDYTYSGYHDNSAYNKFILPNKKWNYIDEIVTLCNCGSISTHTLFFDTDTIISGTTYKKMMRRIFKYDGIDTVYSCALREDTINQKIYVRTGNTNEKLLYSFNHQTGDTISIDTTSQKDYYTVRYVCLVDSFDFNGFKGKKIGICDTTFLTANNSSYESFKDEWYEGIGSLTNINDLSETPTLGTGNELLCLWNNNIQLYQNPNRNYCEYSEFLAITEIEKNSITAFPNPTKDLIEIKTMLDIKELSVYDTSGRLILQQEQKIIDMSTLLNGLYILKIELADGKFIDQKIVKE